MHKIFNLDKGASNHHGTQKKGEPWNKETIKGWKITAHDMIKANSYIDGFGDRLLWYYRFILYKPDGSCWYFDVAIPKFL